jgi:hypothetical protein
LTNIRCKGNIQDFIHIAGKILKMQLNRQKSAFLFHATLYNFMERQACVSQKKAIVSHRYKNLRYYDIIEYKQSEL